MTDVIKICSHSYLKMKIDKALRIICKAYTFKAPPDIDFVYLLLLMKHLVVCL